MRILIAVDGSKQAIDAVSAARCLSPPEEVVLVHAVEPPTPMVLTGAEVYLPYSAEMQKGLRERGRRILDEAAAQLRPKISSVVTRLEIGSAADVILSEAEKEQVDLVLVGARGLGRVRELMLGSVSYRVLYHAPCPVMVIPASMPESVRHVLAPIQGQGDADALVRFLRKNPFPGPLDIRVLHVLPVTDPLWPIDAFRADADVRKAIDETTVLVNRVAAQLRELGHEAAGATGLGAPAPSIFQEAESMSADLIVLGARSRPGISRVLLGSVSHTVIHNAKTPVLVLR